VSLSDRDLVHLRRAVALARQALERGDEPFGSLLVSEQGDVLFEDHNHVVELEATQHPEFAIARWAAAHLSPAERAASTVYTSGEHCPMCAAAHGWAGLGRIAYAVSSAQLTAWRSAWGGPASPVTAYPIGALVPGIVVDGPAPELQDEVRLLHASFAGVDPRTDS
jgi:tRNA(Arg) A34 adenosine deaminase TadA